MKLSTGGRCYFTGMTDTTENQMTHASLFSGIGGSGKKYER